MTHTYKAYQNGIVATKLVPEAIRVPVPRASEKPLNSRQIAARLAKGESLVEKFCRHAISVENVIYNVQCRRDEAPEILYHRQMAKLLRKKMRINAKLCAARAALSGDIRAYGEIVGGFR